MLPSLSQVMPLGSFTRTPCCTALRLPDICTLDGIVAQIVALFEQRFLMGHDFIFLSGVFLIDFVE